MAQNDKNIIPRPLGRGCHEVTGEGLSDKNVSKAHRKRLVPYCLSNLVSSQKAAFTLAEVLITLGIIGIVAAMTIPTLVSKIQEAHFHAKWKECYAILNNAFKMTVAENPRMVASELNNYYPTREFIDAILSHLQVVETCGLTNSIYDVNNCDNYSHYKDSQIKYKWSGIANIYSRYTTLAGGKINSYDFCQKAALLKNGASIYFGGLHSGLTILVDVNNFNGGPNVLGKDVYAISLTSTSWQTYAKMQYIESLYFKPFGAEGTRTEKDGYAGCGVDIGDPNSTSYLYNMPGAGCSYKYLYEK